MPLPIPRPTRLRFAVAPLGGFNVERLVGTLIPFSQPSRDFHRRESYSVSLSVGIARPNV
jgi:hypothetical protein